MKFIGRKYERALLHRLIGQDSFEAVLIFGRRRVGKSELIKQVLKETDVKSIYYECKQTGEMNNVESLAELVSQAFGFPPLAFKNLEDLLRFVFEYTKKEKLILVLDEYSYLKEKTAGIDSVLQSLIDQFCHESNLKLILCGSYVEMMKSIIEPHNPLYGRISQTIDLKAMDYADSSLFYEGFSNEDKVRLYSVFGGIPYYNRLIDPSKSVRENIIDLIAAPGSRLEFEVQMYLKSEISKIANANEVFEAMSKGYSKYSDLLAHSHVSSGPTLIDVLEKLIKMEIVEKRTPINDLNNKKRSGYFIFDSLSLFYYKYIYRYASQRQVMDFDLFYDTYIRDDFETQHVPLIFESICKQYLIRQNKANQLKEPFYLIGKYYYDDPKNKRNGEFDLVTEDRNGYVFYEVKFTNSKVSKAVVQKEIEQVKNTGLNCYRYGFFSKSGYEEFDLDDVILFDLDDLFDVMMQR